MVGAQRAACSEKMSWGVWLTSGFQIFSPMAEGSCEAVAALATGVCRSDLCASVLEDRFGDEEDGVTPSCSGETEAKEMPQGRPRSGQRRAQDPCTAARRLPSSLAPRQG